MTDTTAYICAVILGLPLFLIVGALRDIADYLERIAGPKPDPLKKLFDFGAVKYPEN